MTLTVTRPGSDEHVAPLPPDAGAPTGGDPTPPAERPERKPARKVDAPAGSQAVSIFLGMVSGVLIFLVINLVLISQLEHYTSQTALYSQLRLSLAEGATPVTPLAHNGKLVTPGTPLAIMKFPSLGISKEVVVEGSTASQTMQGIGHRRDTVLPCQVGTSVLMARAGAYGGVGSAWQQLKPGDTFEVTMGQGHCTYQVMDQRLAGDKAPAAPVDRQGRVVLTTAAGLPFMPTEVQRIDANLITKAYDRPASAFPAGSLPDSESAMGVDTSQLFGLVIFMEVLIGLAIAGVWLWRRWGRWHAFIAIAPLAIGFGLLAANNVNHLLPNLL